MALLCPVLSVTRGFQFLVPFPANWKRPPIHRACKPFELILVSLWALVGVETPCKFGQSMFVDRYVPLAGRGSIG